MKKMMSLILAVVLTIVLTMPSMAVEAGEERVAIGADLTTEQKAMVYEYFGLEQGTIKEIEVNISDEKAYLEKVDPSRIGSRSLSSVYILTKEADEGLDISLHNIDWLTKEIYLNALFTSGITDAKVIIASPVPVSGTAALTGIYKAYEDITGEKLDEEAKQAATEELITTGYLADEIGSEDAADLVNELKLNIDKLKNMTDEEARIEINNIAVNLNIILTDSQIDQLLSLVRSLENVDLSRLIDSEGFWEGVVNFFSGIWKAITDFFSSLFG